MPVSFSCPHCARLLSIAAEYAGQRGLCPHCHETLDVPPVPCGAADPMAVCRCETLDREFRPATTALVLLFCVLLFALANFALVPLTSWCRPTDPSAILVYSCIGAIGAQAALHAIWCILAPVGFVVRLVVGIGAGWVLFAAFVLGIELDASQQGYPGASDEMYSALLCLPLVAVAIQSPLWIVHNWYGWRIVHTTDVSASSGARTFGIRDMLVATTIFAMALSAARLGKPADFASETEFLFPLALGALVAGGISLLTTLPLTAATLRARRWWLALGITLVVYVIVALASIEIIGVITGQMTPPDVYPFLLWTGAGFFGCLSGVLLLMRRLGYRLLSGRPRHEHDFPEPAPNASPSDRTNEKVAQVSDPGDARGEPPLES